MTRPSRTPNTSRGMVTITGERHCANCRRVASQSMLVCLLVLISRLPLAVAEYAPYGQQVLLESVKSITLHKGRETTYRRTFSIPQLKCLSGCDYQPDVVQCQNKWSDGKDVQWDCDADLPSGVQFGWTEVICEGYKSAEDKYVLEGSCGLEYSLKHTGFWQRVTFQSALCFYHCYLHWLFVLSYMLPKRRPAVMPFKYLAALSLQPIHFNPPSKGRYPAYGCG
eukprot:c23559_g1_i2 orf=340-1011(-)